MPRTLRARNDYGLKIAKRGYDVTFASDNQLLYNSSFPVLQIVMYITGDTQWEIVKTGPYQHWNEITGTLTTRYKHSIKKLHGLDYAPMVVPFGYDVASSADRLEWNTRYIYFEKNFLQQADYDAYMAGGAKTPSAIVFGVDISTDVEYPYTDDGLEIEWGQTYDYGIKHLLTSDVNSTDPADLGLNANVQSIMAVAIKVATNDKPDVSLFVPDGMSPTQLAPFCFLKSSVSGRWRAGGVSAQAVSGFRPARPQHGINYYELDGQKIEEKCSLVLVRLPMIAPDRADYSVVM